MIKNLFQNTAIIFSIFIFTLSVHAQETVTLTTYYPSPFGVYQELEINQSLLMTPWDGSTLTCGPGGVGTGLIYYDDTDGLSICDGTGWNGNAGVWKLTGTSIYPKEFATWNVGIGTDTPTADVLLDVEGDIEISGNARAIYMGRDGEPGPHGLVFFDQNNPGNVEASLVYRTSTNRLRFEDAGGNAEFALGVDANGDGNGLAWFNGQVAIGTSTSTPGTNYQLMLDGRNDSTRMALQNDATGQANNNGLELKMESSNTAALWVRENSGSLSLGIGENTAAPLNQLILTDTGNVGIGTAAPNVALHLRSGQSRMRLQGSAPGIWLNRDGSPNSIFVGSYLASSDFSVHMANNPATWNTFRIANPSGNIGIGAAPTADKLYVQGNAVVDGSITANEHYYPSDASMKENIESLNGVESIMQLEGVRYTWKKDGKTDIGVTAQNVEEVFPEIVQTNETTGLKTIKSDRIIAPLIEAVKEQQQMIEAQQNQIQELRQELETLKLTTF